MYVCVCKWLTQLIYLYGGNFTNDAKEPGHFATFQFKYIT
jgi:hypothetical protein